MKKLALSVVLLGLSSFAMADLSATCQTYFDSIDEYIKDMPTAGLTAEQLEMMKSGLEQSKQQVAAMPTDTQESACKQGIEALKQAQAATPTKK